MELVYLWVEKYKNIKEQGFNFSPRFECKYENNELTIIEKKEDEYIKDFFGKNINVTAIVGKNGSGKSSILDILSGHLGNMKILFLKNNQFYTNLNLNQETLRKYNIEYIYNDDFYDYNIINLNTHCNDDTNSNDCRITILSEVLTKDADAFTYINENFIFKYWRIQFNKSLPNLNLGIDALDKKYKSPNVILNPLTTFDIIVYVAIKLILYILANNPLNESHYWEALNNLSNDFSEDNYQKLVNIIDLERFNGVANYNLILETLQEYQQTIQIIDNFTIIKEMNTVDIQEFINSGVYKTFYGFSKNNFGTEIVKIDFLTENELNFLDLSDGEKNRIFVASLLVNDIIGYDTNSDLIITYDEPDSFLHPSWQKKIISDFSFLLNKYISENQHIHFIITTHSPFLLSDIPKQNIIFLDKDENGNSKVVDGLKEKKQTFGANIHTLLSDSFFMEDGLMGEFAKGKINEIKDFYEKVIEEKKTDENIEIYSEYQEKFWQIQKIIGEPFLQKIVQNQLEEIELILLGRDEAIDNEIARLQALKESSKNA